MKSYLSNYRNWVNKQKQLPTDIVATKAAIDEGLYENYTFRDEPRAELSNTESICLSIDIGLP